MHTTGATDSVLAALCTRTLSLRAYLSVELRLASDLFLPLLPFPFFLHQALMSELLWLQR